MSFEEGLFFLLDAVISEEVFKGLQSVVFGVLITDELIVVVTARLVRQYREGVADFIEYPLGLDSIGGVPVWVPLRS